MNPDGFDPALFDRAWLGVMAAAGLLVVRAVVSALLPRGYHFRVMDRLLMKDEPHKEDDE